MSNLLELAGMGLFTTAIYWLAGRPAAFIAAAVFLVVLGIAVDGNDLALRAHLSRGLAKAASLLRPRFSDDGAETEGPGDG